MNKELPFEIKNLHKHRIAMKAKWKHRGMKFKDNNHFENWYEKYIYSSKCELCNKEFKNKKDRQLDHNHSNGEIRNILCNKCNFLRKDRKINSNNTSGYKGISKLIHKKYKQGYTWEFSVTFDGKKKKIKNCINKEKLIEFAEKWKIENNYYT